MQIRLILMKGRSRKKLRMVQIILLPSASLKSTLIIGSTMNLIWILSAITAMAALWLRLKCWSTNLKRFKWFHITNNKLSRVDRHRFGKQWRLFMTTSRYKGVKRFRNPENRSSTGYVHNIINEGVWEILGNK